MNIDGVKLHTYCNNNVFYTTLHERSWLKCDTYSIIQALM